LKKKRYRVLGPLKEKIGEMIVMLSRRSIISPSANHRSYLKMKRYMPYRLGFSSHHQADGLRPDAPQKRILWIVCETFHCWNIFINSQTGERTNPSASGSFLVPSEEGFPPPVERLLYHGYCNLHPSILSLLLLRTLLDVTAKRYTFFLYARTSSRITMILSPSPAP
jgi:hypothetical protein